MGLCHWQDFSIETGGQLMLLRNRIQKRAHLAWFPSLSALPLSHCTATPRKMPKHLSSMWYIPRHFKISNCSIYKHDRTWLNYFSSRISSDEARFAARSMISGMYCFSRPHLTSSWLWSNQVERQIQPQAGIVPGYPWDRDSHWKLQFSLPSHSGLNHYPLEILPDRCCWVILPMIYRFSY